MGWRKQILPLEKLNPLTVDLVPTGVERSPNVAINGKHGALHPVARQKSARQRRAYIRRAMIHDDGFDVVARVSLGANAFKSFDNPLPAITHRNDHADLRHFG